MDATDLGNEIRSRGYWRVNVRPTVFIPERVALRELEAITRDSIVQLRGWDYPHFPREGVTRGNDFIEGATEAAFISHLEVWRLYQSGQFIHLFSMREDWVEGTPLPGLGNVKPGELLSLESTLYTITEIFLFAARLAQRMAQGHALRQPRGEQKDFCDGVECGFQTQKLAGLHIAEPGQWCTLNPILAHTEQMDELAGLIEAPYFEVRDEGGLGGSLNEIVPPCHSFARKMGIVPTAKLND